jgi:Protein of unknown function (DUF2924)
LPSTACSGPRLRAQAARLSPTTALAAIASKRGALADMDKAAIDVAKALVRLSELTIFELRGEWRRLHRTPPPMRLSRDLLTRGISYKLQERAYGGLSTATARRLEQAADSLRRGAVKPAPLISLDLLHNRHATLSSVL